MLVEGSAKPLTQRELEAEGSAKPSRERTGAAGRLRNIVMFVLNHTGATEQVQQITTSTQNTHMLTDEPETKRQKVIDVLFSKTFQCDEESRAPST